MSKSLYIAEKPSVAREFARVLNVGGRAQNGYMESDNAIVTWCVGHLVTMSYPEKYDPKYRKWNLETLPFLPSSYLYEIIPSAEKQFKIVRSLLERSDVETIYVCTDAGREGEYIYRLVESMCSPKVAAKDRRRVWIDSQTEEEIQRGVREAKNLESYNNLSASAYLRAKEDYLMGINFSRLLTVKYGNLVTGYLGGKWSAISVGRVMTCVLGMVVRREREIRNFVKTPFFRVQGNFGNEKGNIDAMWHVVPGSRYEGSPKLYKDSGFLERKDAEELIRFLTSPEMQPLKGTVSSVSRKTEKKNAPLLYNLAEIQNDASRIFRISPDQTLNIIQELYEKKLVTYPRTDARVLSSAIAKEIDKNLRGLKNYAEGAPFADEILGNGSWRKIEKSHYTNDKLVTDHYAIIPTGQGLGALRSLNPTAKGVYDLIAARFLSIFYPPAVYQKTAIEIMAGKEAFSASSRVLKEKGYLAVVEAVTGRGRKEAGSQENGISDKENGAQDADASLLLLESVKKGTVLNVNGYAVKEGETAPPKRYTSGSIILAMENAGQLIEDEELREQIRGSGIGTSATRAEILKKLFTIRYLSLNQKTQVITPALLGELVYETVDGSLRQMLNPDLTASWEKGLTYVSEGSVSESEYMEKLENFISRRVTAVSGLHNEAFLRGRCDAVAGLYKSNRKTNGRRR
ncbi:MAG: type IA DNA topoisomerase [Lachnospiraceae bacterium]|nr:type IA DNA topoisomerase [Lachnospiraceae bacterium]